MRIHTAMTLALMAVSQQTITAQTVVTFDVNAQGKSTPVAWGMDTAWDDEYNVKWGIAHYGKNFTTGRISFQPYELVDASKIDDAGANFGLPLKMARKLQARIDKIKWTGTTRVAINCDHEVLTRKLDENGNYGNEEDNVGKGNYVPTSYQADATKTTAWVNLIKATAKYAQAQGLTVESVSPFNEPDYGWNQYYNGTPGTNTSNQQNYGMRDLKALYTALKADAFFSTGAGKDIRMCGPNTLNCDRALPWYNYSGMAALIDEGNTHQLSGSFDNYANFFKTISDAGKVATADELHNVGEAIVGIEYGMTNGIWWAFDGKARGQFMMDTNEGARIGYAEDRTHWTSAAVYRNDKSNQIHGFIGSSERQANASTYTFRCADRDVYFNGYGPQREWSVTTVGGASGSYQKGQINYEYLFDITYGEDVQSFAVDGNYQIMSAADQKLITSHGNPNDITCDVQTNNNSQRWHIYPDNVKAKGDCSYWFIDNVGDANLHLNLRNGSLDAGTKVLTYNANHDALEQWYFRYAQDGYFYITTHQSNKYLYNNNGSISVEDALEPSTSASKMKKYLWRLMPADAQAENTAPAIPAGLAEGTVTASDVTISWDALSEANVTYNVLRQDANGWNTIARCQSSTSYTDNKIEAGKAYKYRVQAVDYSGNRSETSEALMIVTPTGGSTPTYTAGKWEWIGETAAAGNYYINSVAHGTFLNTNNGMDVAANTLWTLTASGKNWDISSDDKHISMTRSGSFLRYTYSNNTGAASGTVALTQSTKFSGAYMITGTYAAGSYLSQTSSSAINTNSRATSDANTSTWYFISSDQMTQYGKMDDYTTAFTTASGFLSQPISAALSSELQSTLDACNGTVNHRNIDTYISLLQTVSGKCQEYLDNPPVISGEDMTGLIVNPGIQQNGTTNDAPTGWVGAKTNVTGNGHYTEGTGNTRLEAWHWNRNLNADYYQDIIVPNGLYTLTAVTHQRANGNAALYGVTYRSFETTMPVGDGNEAETSVQDILVTDGVMRIGVKVSGLADVDQWMTADDFTLTRVSTPAETPLSHYTSAVAYLNDIAATEMERNVDHQELIAARNAANSCAADAASYESAINNYIAAIKNSLLQEEKPDADPGEVVIDNTWIGSTGGYSDAAERYNDNQNFAVGKVLYKIEEDLIPGATYTVEFYAVANFANHAWLPDLNSGSGIAQVYAGDQTKDITVHKQTGCTPTSELHTFTVAANEDGVIEYGIRNIAAGGNWYVAKSKSLTCLGIAHSATLSCRAGKYGTFVAPYDVTLPEGITAFSAEVDGDCVTLEAVAEAGETLTANTPVIIKNTSQTQVSRTYNGYCTNLRTVTADGNPLVGFLQDDETIPVGAYVLQTQDDIQAFYLVDAAFTGTANRCYLNVPVVQAQSRSLRILHNNDVTDIHTMEVSDMDAECKYYSLDGQLLAKPKRGINIIRNADGTTAKKIFY